MRTIKLEMLVKDVNIRTLVTGDKHGRVIMDTLDPKYVDEIARLSKEKEVIVRIDRLDQSKMVYGVNDESIKYDEVIDGLSQDVGDLPTG